MTIRVVSVTVGSKVIVDRTPKGVPNAGDIFWKKSNLRNERPQFGKPKGALVGTEVAVYTVGSPAVGTVRETTRFPGGTVRASDRRSYEGCCATESQVTGGTGFFTGARGTVISEPLTRGFGLLGEPNLKVYRLHVP